VLHEGRNLDTVVQAEIIRSHAPRRAHPMRYSDARVPGSVDYQRYSYPYRATPPVSRY
jgi:hypothetical protein